MTAAMYCHVSTERRQNGMSKTGHNATEILAELKRRGWTGGRL